MAEQLRHLRKVAEWPGVSLRILPFAAGVHGAMNSAFIILDFPHLPHTSEPMEPPLVYVDTFTGALHLNKATEAQAYELIWKDLGSRAFDEDSSTKLIIEALEALANG